jgi:hypothetical protein
MSREGSVNGASSHHARGDDFVTFLCWTIDIMARYTWYPVGLLRVTRDNSTTMHGHTSGGHKHTNTHGQAPTASSTNNKKHIEGHRRTGLQAFMYIALYGFIVNCSLFRCTCSVVPLVMQL